ncbi:MAG: PrsW family intramembrane metalloprotease [Anaerolineales bacterium]|nr:PrsW family intramembrane metalloprotease [Anaerolineales bacterium]
MLKIAKVMVGIAGFSIAFLGLLAGVLYLFPPFIRGGEIDLLRATMGASFIALGIGLGLPLAWQGFRSLRGLPSRLFRPRPAWLLVAVFIVAVILGQVVLTLDLLPALTFPPFYVLAAVLPPLFFLAFVGRRLAESHTRWRDVVLQLASGAFLATFGAFGVEAAFGLLSMVGVFILAALTPGGDAWLQELAASLQDPRWLQSPENLYSSLLSPPVLIALGLLVLVIAPMIEELFKSLGVVMMSYRRPFGCAQGMAQGRPGKAQSFLWGLAGGAGFALAESLFNGAASLEGWAGAAILRVGATAMHCLGSGLMGLGWYYLFATRRPWRLLGTYAASVSLHSLWNVAASGMLVVSLSATSPATDEVGLALGGLVIVALMGFLSLLALSTIFTIFYLTRWLRAQMPSAIQTITCG